MVAAKKLNKPTKKIISPKTVIAAKRVTLKNKVAVATRIKKTTPMTAKSPKRSIISGAFGRVKSTLAASFLSAKRSTSTMEQRISINADRLKPTFSKPSLGKGKPVIIKSKTSGKKIQSAIKPKRKNLVTPKTTLMIIALLSTSLLLLQQVQIKSSLTESPAAFTKAPKATVLALETSTPVSSTPPTSTPTSKPTTVVDLNTGAVGKASVSPSPDNILPIAAATGQRTYTVKAGDTLWSIAQNAYGSGFKWKEIAQANKIQGVSIEVGASITLPGDTQGTTLAKTEVKPIASLDTQAASAIKTISQTSYTIKTGDSLWSIAEKVYGDSYQWHKIAKANNLITPSVIHVGNILTIPPVS